MQKRLKPGPRRRSATEWRRIIERWERSKQSAAVFADEQHLSKRSLTWWRWRLRTGSTPTMRSDSAAKLTFVPLLTSSRGQSSAGSAEACWVLETGTGLRVEMSGATTLVIDGLGAAIERVRGWA